jgi:conjugal transfer pilus assembly protein TraU
MNHNHKMKNVYLVTMVIYLLIGNSVFAGSLCPDAKIFSNLIEKVCWTCMLPIRVMGAPMGDTGLAINKPDGAADQDVACSCVDDNGVPIIGIPMALWVPSRLIETVRNPYCSPVAAGNRFKSDVSLMGGQKTGSSKSEMTFLNYHIWYFPLYSILDIFFEPSCRGDGFTDIDLAYMSELDPTHNDDILAFMLAPETAMFANPIAQAACGGDAVAATEGTPLEHLYWCAGSWGNIYPMTGNIPHDGSPVNTAALVTTKAMAAMHRRGLARKTIGEDAMCGAKIFPMLPKSQYRFQHMFPVSESSGSCCHPIGASTFSWGEHRVLPGKGEDFVNLVWNYTDCCAR